MSWTAEGACFLSQTRRRKEYTDINTNYLFKPNAKPFQIHNWIKSHVNEIDARVAVEWYTFL